MVPQLGLLDLLGMFVIWAVVTVLIVSWAYLRPPEYIARPFNAMIRAATANVRSAAEAWGFKVRCVDSASTTVHHINASSPDNEAGMLRDVVRQLHEMQGQLKNIQRGQEVLQLEENNGDVGKAHMSAEDDESSRFTL